MTNSKAQKPHKWLWTIVVSDRTFSYFDVIFFSSNKNKSTIQMFNNFWSMHMLWQSCRKVVEKPHWQRCFLDVAAGYIDCSFSLTDCLQHILETLLLEKATLFTFLWSSRTDTYSVAVISSMMSIAFVFSLGWKKGDEGDDCDCEQAKSIISAYRWHLPWNWYGFHWFIRFFIYLFFHFVGDALQAHFVQFCGIRRRIPAFVCTDIENRIVDFVILIEFPNQPECERDACHTI